MSNKLNSQAEVIYKLPSKETRKTITLPFYCKSDNNHVLKSNNYISYSWAVLDKSPVHNGNKEYTLKTITIEGKCRDLRTPLSSLVIDWVQIVYQTGTMEGLVSIKGNEFLPVAFTFKEHEVSEEEFDKVIALVSQSLASIK